MGLDKMFGFIFNQPIHQTLRQMRVGTMVMLGVSVDIMYRLVAILEQSGELSTAQTAGAVATLAAAVFATIWKCVNNFSEAHKKDEV